MFEIANQSVEGGIRSHRADPPYTQNTQAALGPLALKYVLILVLFLNLASCCENMNDHFF